MLVKYLRYLVRDQIFTLFSIGFIIAYWAQVGSLPFVSIRYPMVVTGVACIFIVWNLGLSMIQFRKKLREEGEAGVKVSLRFGLNGKKWAVIGITALYIRLIPIVGYVVTTTLYMVGLCLFLGIRKPLNIAIYTVVLVASLYAVFGLWLNITLPTGFLI